MTREQIAEVLRADRHRINVTYVGWEARAADRILAALTEEQGREPTAKQVREVAQCTVEQIGSLSLPGVCNCSALALYGHRHTIAEAIVTLYRDNCDDPDHFDALTSTPPPAPREQCGVDATYGPCTRLRGHLGAHEYKAAPAAPSAEPSAPERKPDLGGALSLSTSNPPCAECGEAASKHPYILEHQAFACPSSDMAALTFYRAAPAPQESERERRAMAKLLRDLANEAGDKALVPLAVTNALRAADLLAAPEGQPQQGEGERELRGCDGEFRFAKRREDGDLYRCVKCGAERLLPHG